MNRRRTTLLALAATVTLTSCGTPQPTATVTVTVTPSSMATPTPAASPSTRVATGHGETPTPIPPADYSQAEQVGAAFLIAAYSSDTRTDHGPQDASARAATFAGPELAAALREPRESRADSSWNELVAHGGRYQVTAHLQTIGTETDTDTRVVRAYVVTQTPVADGWTGQPRSWATILTLVSDRHQWLVQEVAPTS